MTSSLVGSEMCIRDSTTVEWQGSTTPTTTVKAAPTATKCTSSSSRISSISVSYTHLTLPTICSV
eukprot:9816966-Prorocentrum_lima.AAC.1